MLYMSDAYCLFARKGEEIRNEHDALVATFARDVFKNEDISPGMFIFPGEAPVGGMRIDPAIVRFAQMRNAQRMREAA